MKIIDTLRFSLHNVGQNKSRSIIIMAAVYLLSALIMVVLCMAISLSPTYRNMLKAEAEESGISLDYRAEYASSSLFDNDIYRELKKTLDKKSDYISAVEVSFLGIGSYDFDYFDYFDNGVLELIEGEPVSPALSGTDAIYLCESYVGEYNLGDKYISEDYEFTVKGFYRESQNYPNFDFFNMQFCDTGYMLENGDGFYNLTINLLYNKSLNFGKAIAAYSQFCDTLKSLSGDRQNLSLHCQKVEEVEYCNATTALWVGGAAAIALVLLLLSVGSISNVIRISVDENGRTLATMRCLGATDGDVFKVLMWEYALTIVLGVILAFITIICLQSPLQSLMLVLTRMFSSSKFEGLKPFLKFVCPWYVPVLCIVFYAAFTLLFGWLVFKKSCRKNPMVIINSEER